MENQDKNITDMSSNDEALTFCHISRNASNECAANFINDGIKPSSGNGYGGQDKGFYVWTSEERGDMYYQSLLSEEDADWAKEKFDIDIKLKEGKALKITVSPDKKDIKHPVWQLDSEQHPNAKFGRDRSVLLDMWETQKDYFQSNPAVEIPYKDNVNKEVAGKNEFVTDSYTIKEFGWNDEKKCPSMKCYDENKKEFLIKDIDVTNADVSGRSQAINNFLCENVPGYKEKYDQLLLAVASNKQSLDIGGKTLNLGGLPIKYCGKEVLPVNKVALVQGELTEKYGKRLKPESLSEVKYRDFKMLYTETDARMIGLNQSNSNKISNLRKRLAQNLDKNLGNNLDKIQMPQIIKNIESKISSNLSNKER